jgi:hypothetical protein
MHEITFTSLNSKSSTTTSKNTNFKAVCFDYYGFFL